MKKIYSIIVLCLLIGNNLEAAERNISVRPIKEDFFITTPRKIITTSFRVTNNTKQKREFISEIKLPDGWTLITKDVPFMIESKDTDIRLLSIFVPQTALAGKYPINYLVKDRENPSFIGLYTIFVTVLPLIKIKAELFQAPKYVVAGESYQIDFIVTNESNIETTLRVTVNSNENYPFKLDMNEFKLCSGESRKVKVMMETDKDIQKGLKHIIRLTAEVIEDNGTEGFSIREDGLIKGRRTNVKYERIKAHAIASIDIVPRISQAEDRFHEIPGEITFKWASEKDEDKKSGFQTKISGKGELDEEKKRNLEFLFEISDDEYESIYSIYDEYTISYRAERQEFHLGDRSYYLSPLTENYLYGCGIEGKQTFDDFYVKAYQMKTRKFRPHETQTGAHINYLINDIHQFSLNYLNKKNENNHEGIVSIYGTSKPIRDTAVEFEYANNSKDDAYMLNLSGYQNRVFYYLKFIHADPNYHGYYTDMDFISSSFTFSLTDYFRLKTYFRQEKDNLHLNPQRGSALLDRFYGFGFNYHFNTGTNLSLDLRFQKRVDRIPDPAMDYNEDSFRLGIGHNFKKLNLFSSIELSHIVDRLANKTVDSENYMINAYFRQTNKLNYKGYLYWKDNGKVTGETKHNLTTGLGVSYRVMDRTFFNLNFQADHYKESVKNQIVFEMELNHTLLNKHKISVFGRRSSYEDPFRKDETIFMMEYSLPFGLPIRRKKSVGGIKGRIFDFETKEPLSNVILRLNGFSAVTDRKGNFIFPSVHPGTFHLSVDRTGIASNKIPVLKTPIEITVSGGKDCFIEIPIGRSAAISGNIILYQTENDSFMFDTNQKLVERGGLKNLIVEMSSGSEMSRRVTDNKGYFAFEELQPGNWTLRIYKAGLPEYHHLERDEFEFELKPGERQEILIKVLPNIRHIHFIDKGDLLIEEEKE